MKKSNFLYLLFCTCLAIIAIGISACYKTDEMPIPAYIHIDTSSVISSGTEGTASHKIVDAWVYKKDNIIGAFEMPATFPILETGTVELTFYAGIKLNGIAETRVPYPFFDPIKRSVRLAADSVTKISNLKYSYSSHTVFEWTEDFEQYNLSLDTAKPSTLAIQRVSLPELMTAFPGEGNEYAAKVELSSDTGVFYCRTHNEYSLPTNGTETFLEMNFKTNNELQVGILPVGLYASGHTIIVLNPSATWNKIYINLTPSLSTFTEYSSFKIFFYAKKSASAEKAVIYFDNLKLIHL